MRRFLSKGTPKENVGLARNQKLLESMELDDKHTIEFRDVTLGEFVGEGGFAKVYKCQIDGRAGVCKEIQSKNLDDEARYLLKNECTIWSRLAHQNIVGFLGMTSDATRLWLLCEFMAEGSLHQKHERRRRSRAAPPTEELLINQLQQVASGMDYLHALEPPVLHRDLKSPNILLQGDRLAIADFGLARYQERSGAGDMTAETGSYRWMAPEVIRHEKYDMRCDVYSYAILGWEMLTDRVPFDDVMPVEAAFGVAKSARRPPMPESAPESIQTLITTCWAQEAKQRPSFSTICAALAEEVQALAVEAKVGHLSVDEKSGEQAPAESKA